MMLRPFAVAVIKGTGSAGDGTGPAGPPGPPGPPGDAGGALLINNRLSELAADPEAQLAAQTNIGLGAVDLVASYLLAKS